MKPYTITFFKGKQEFSKMEMEERPILFIFDKYIQKYHIDRVEMLHFGELNSMKVYHFPVEFHQLNLF